MYRVRHTTYSGLQKFARRVSSPQLEECVERCIFIRNEPGVVCFKTQSSIVRNMSLECPGIEDFKTPRPASSWMKTTLYVSQFVCIEKIYERGMQSYINLITMILLRRPGSHAAYVSTNTQAPVVVRTKTQMHSQRTVQSMPCL